MTRKADLIVALEAKLPQTQCRRCHYNDCHDYAKAIANEQADINRCSPGGEWTIAALAKILQRVDQKRPDPECEDVINSWIAEIDEKWCIGCTLCIQACPVDSIVGAAKLMHTVLEDYCNGCGLCLPVCPVDCIEQKVISDSPPNAENWLKYKANFFRSRYQRHLQRVNVTNIISSCSTKSTNDRLKLIKQAVSRVRSNREDTQLLKEKL